jgi:hypothetical protein
VATFITIGFLLLCFIAWMLRDSFRFGRDGFPWLVAVGMAGLFGGMGFWLVGDLGALLGAPILVAFGCGKHAAVMADRSAVRILSSRQRGRSAEFAGHERQTCTEED